MLMDGMDTCGEPGLGYDSLGLNVNCIFDNCVSEVHYLFYVV